MSSERRIQASRANGARSRGPVTARGKINSSKNSTRHGILAQTVVLDSESKSRFEELLNAYTGEFQPRTPAETTLVETLAIARWRPLRVCHIQRASFDLEMARSQAAVSSNPVRAATAFRELSDNSHSLDLMLRYETAFDRQFTRALNALLKLQSRPGRDKGPDLPPQTSTAATWDPDDPPGENQDEPFDLPNEPTNLLKTGEARGTTDSTPAEIHPAEPSPTIKGSAAPQRTAPCAGPKRGGGAGRMCPHSVGRFERGPSLFRRHGRIRSRSPSAGIGSYFVSAGVAVSGPMPTISKTTSLSLAPS